MSAVLVLILKLNWGEKKQRLIQILVIKRFRINFFSVYVTQLSDRARLVGVRPSSPFGVVAVHRLDYWSKLLPIDGFVSW